MEMLDFSRPLETKLSLSFVLQWGTVWGPRWRGTSWPTSTIRLSSSCTMVSQTPVLSLERRNSRLALLQIPENDWECVCSIPDGREALLDPGLPQRRRSLHETFQRGSRDAFGCNDSVEAFSSSPLPPAGDVYRGGRQVLSGRAGTGTGPPPQPGHHLQRPQTWEVRTCRILRI